jgi:hypothetical protein
LRFWARGRTGEFRQLGAVAYGVGPIDRLEFRVIVPGLRAPVDVALDNIAIEAARLIEPPAPATSMIGPRVWLGVIVVLVAVVAIWLWWRRLA